MPMTGRKHISKKEVLKLKPGTFVRLMWNDAPDEVVVLLDKPDNEPGDVSLHYLTDEGHRMTQATYKNVVAVLTQLKWWSEFETVESSGTGEEIFNAEAYFTHSSAERIALTDSD